MKLNQRNSDKGIEARQPSNGWDKSSLFVLTNINELLEVTKDIQKEQINVRLDIKGLKIKSSLYYVVLSSLSGLIPAIGLVLYILIKNI